MRRAINEAISSRGTNRPGQNVVLAGGLHPLPRSANPLMLLAWVWPGSTSTKIDALKPEPQGVHQDGGHLGPGQLRVGAELGVGRRVAAFDDPGGGYGVDVGLVGLAVVVIESIGAGRQVECVDDDRGRFGVRSRSGQ